MEDVAARVAGDIEDGWLVNVGIGWPQAVVPHLVGRPAVVLHSENGIVGMGPPPSPGMEDPDVVNAGKGLATIRPGGSFMDSVTSFTLIRGGRLSLALMGAYSVSAGGDLANWRIAGRKVAGIGGAADLAYGAARVWIVTRMFTESGRPKLLPECPDPLTARAVVHRVYTDYGVFEPTGSTFRVIEAAPNVDLDELAAAGVCINAG